MTLTRESFIRRVSSCFSPDSARDKRLCESEKEIAEALEHELNLDDRVIMTRPMHIISGYHTAVGTLICSDDAFSGWKQIKRGMLYYYWRCKILNRQWLRFGKRIRRGFANSLHIANYAALCLRIMNKEGNWFLDLMDRSLSDGFLNWGNDDGYPLFLVRLHRKLNSNEEQVYTPEKIKENTMPYNNVFEHWNNSDKLLDTITTMCDYHLRWNDSDTPNHYAEFSDYFAAFNPVEIHALEYVRKNLGLVTPNLKHELLQVPFYPIPDFVDSITTEDILKEDKLLSEIIRKNKDWCEHGDTDVYITEKLK